MTKIAKNVAQNKFNTPRKNSKQLHKNTNKIFKLSRKTIVQQKIKPQYNFPYAALEHLKAQLKNKMMTDEFAYFNRPRSLSIFHDLPDAAPHYKRQLSLSEKQEKMTTSYSNSITIIKGDNGHCILRQDLSNVGMDGVIALSGFNCGQTKMERMYDKHMTKVLKKLGKR